MKAVDYYVKVGADTKASLESSTSCSSDYHIIECKTTSSPVLRRARYRLWVLVLILLLAVWSMFTGSLNLHWSTAAATLVDDFDDYPLRSDLDILEVEEREKVVRRMWDLYTHSKRIRLPKFWQRAFEAAYEDLMSDVSAVRNAAVLEISRMSLISLDLIVESLPQSTNAYETNRTPVKVPISSKLHKSRRGLVQI